MRILEGVVPVPQRYTLEPGSGPACASPQKAKKLTASEPPTKAVTPPAFFPPQFANTKLQEYSGEMVFMHLIAF